MSKNSETIVVVVNGEPVPVPVNENAEIEALIAKALELSHNNGQPIGNWVLKDAAGDIIDPHQKLKNLKLSSTAKLYLSLNAGVGGHA